jgi:H+/Cl- antiporter ClcA
MKAALLFLATALLVAVLGYTYYLSIGGTPLEELVNHALGLEGENAETAGLPIVVSLIPYVAIVTSLIGLAVLLKIKKRAKHESKKSGGE